MFGNVYSIILLHMSHKIVKVVHMIKKPVYLLHVQMCLFMFFQDICVDKARLEECEERASELSRKVSNF